MKTWLPICKIHTIVRVGMLKKAQEAWIIRIRKNIDFGIKIEPKSIGKSRKTTLTTQIGKKNVSRRSRFRKKSIFGRFLGPGWVPK